MLAQVRKDLRDENTAVPVFDLGRLKEIYLEGPEKYLAEQPDRLDDQEYNLILKKDGQVFLAHSIDFEYS